MGLSFGGIIALKFAIKYPHRLDRLIVQGVGARYEGGLMQQIAATVLSRFPLPTDSPFINQFFNVLFGRPQEPSPLFQFVTRQCWQTDQSVMAHRFRLVERFDIKDRLERIGVPTLILAADRDLLVSKRSLRALSAGIPGARTVHLPGCGHLAFVAQPRRIADEVCGFLEAL